METVNLTINGLKVSAPAKALRSLRQHMLAGIENSYSLLFEGDQ